MRITKSKKQKNVIIPFENHENHGNQRISSEIRETHEKNKNQCENHLNFENLRIPSENNKNHVIHRIPHKNHENHEDPRIRFEKKKIM